MRLLDGCHAKERLADAYRAYSAAHFWQIDGSEFLSLIACLNAELDSAVLAAEVRAAAVQQALAPSITPAPVKVTYLEKDTAGRLDAASDLLRSARVYYAKAHNGSPPQEFDQKLAALDLAIQQKILKLPD